MSHNEFWLAAYAKGFDLANIWKGLFSGLAHWEREYSFTEEILQLRLSARAIIDYTQSLKGVPCRYLETR